MSTMNRFLALFLVVIGCLGVHTGKAQQIARRSQFVINTFMANPAVAGTMNFTPFFLSYRNQWAGFKGAPVTMMASAHTGLKNGLGFGAIAYHDDTGGAISESGMELTGAYHVDVNNYDAVSFGLSVNASQYAFDNSKLVVYDQNDLALNGGMAERSFNVDATFGFLVYGKQYYAGISIPQLFETRLNLESEILASENRNRRHFQFMGSYKWYASDDWDIQPSAFMRIMGNVPAQMDLNVRAIYKQLAFGGLTYRHRDAVAIMLGGNYREFVFAYSYDVTTSGARVMSPHTHELSIGYYLPKRSGKFRAGFLGPRVLDRSRVVN